jgi:hypothetical protein
MIYLINYSFDFKTFGKDKVLFDQIVTIYQSMFK